MISRSIGALEDENLSPIEKLSDRELEVFEQIGQGETTRQIASKLNLSAKTIETYRENIKHKLNLSNATELTRHAIQWVLENRQQVVSAYLEILLNSKMVRRNTPDATHHPSECKATTIDSGVIWLSASQSPCVL